MTADTYRVLTPSEFQAMKDAPLPEHFKIPTQQRNIWLDVMMFTGMRYKELLYLDSAWHLFDARNNAITLPAKFCKTNIDRVIHLTPAFSKSLTQYLREFKTLELPGRDVMNANLKRWWRGYYNVFTWPKEPKYVKNQDQENIFGLWHPTVKAFRKSWESWLLMADYPIHKVAMSQGHTVAISEHHYANLSPRLKSELEQVKSLTAGWGT